MDTGGTYYKLKDQVSALEGLLRRLPDLTTPVPASVRLPKPGRAKQLDEAQVRELVSTYQAGSTLRELGKRFGISRQTVSTILQRKNVELRQRELGAEQVDELVRLYEAGWSMARIAERLQVDPDYRAEPTTGASSADTRSAGTISLLTLHVTSYAPIATPAALYRHHFD